MKVVITGASRGIGLALTKLGLEKGHEVLAVLRDLSTSELAKIKSDKLHILETDLQDPQSFSHLQKAVEKWEMVDLLINNAGIYREDQELEDFQKSFFVNSIAPLFVTRALLPKLKNSDRPVCVQITSAMGSIGENTSGGSLSYRASKTALNMITKSLALDETWLTCLLIHPGWVKTRMGGEGAPVSPEDSSRGIWQVIERSDLSQSGSFKDFRGMTHSW
jgi:NAD(P)-dependent dehydrogenase (short-subunit alcohol dehydrogenase family)